MKPGFKTSEFWLAFAAMLIGTFVASGLLGPDHVAMRIAGLGLDILAALGYAVVRGKVKVAEQLKEGAAALAKKSAAA